MSREESPHSQSVVDSAQGVVVQIPLRFFLERILPPLRHNLNPRKIVDILTRTRKKSSSQKPITQRKRWRGFAQDPTELDTLHTTNTTFRPIQDVIRYIIKAGGSRTTPIAFRQNPVPLVSDLVRDHTSLPDAYLTTGDGPPRWLDIVAFGEFRKTGMMDATIQNVKKVTRSMSLCMHHDPRRRFVYAFTIENTSMRLWYCDRTQILVSESFNFITEHQPFVHFFLSVLYASQTDLGFDPTMELREDDQYDIAIRLENTVKTYRTLELLSDSRTVDLLGRGTRVWKVVQVEDGQEVGEPMVLKDTWSDPERCPEGQLLERVRAAGRPDDLKSHVDKLFATMVCHGDVHLEDDSRTLDCTPLFGPDNSSKPILHREEIRRGDEGYGPWDSQYTRQRQRVHYRLVLKEVCKPLADETSLSKIYRALGDATLALRVMHSAGWVHRDVSAGNILLKEDGSILLTDLELAKEMGPQDEHEYGTPAFIAVEVHGRRYYFLPAVDRPQEEYSLPKYPLLQRILGRCGPDNESTVEPKKPLVQSNAVSTRPPIPAFQFNPLHDMESLWWLAIYFSVKREILNVEFPEENPIASKAHRSFADELFEEDPLRYDTLTQPHILLEQARGSLPPVAFNLLRAFEELLRGLIQKYREAEKNIDALDHTCADGLYESFQEVFYGVADAELIQDLTVRPFTPLPVQNNDWFYAQFRRGPSSSLSPGSSSKHSHSQSDASDSGRTKRARSDETIVPDTAPARRPYLPRRAKERNVRR